MREMHPEIAHERLRSPLVEELIPEESVEGLRQQARMDGKSVELVILETLSGVLREHGREMNADSRSRVIAILTTFRALALPNMPQDEQEYVQEWSGARITALQSLARPEMRHEMFSIWNMFHLRVPTFRKGVLYDLTKELPRPPARSLAHQRQPLA